MTGLTHNTTYYIVRTGNLTFSLASSLANAQAGTVISLSSDGTGTQTFTLTLTTRALGATGGEENHAMSSTELVVHKHASYTANGSGGTPNGYALQGAGAPGSPVYTYNTDQGGNAAMNVMNPYIVLQYIIKY
jgi:microcystin-dependent protein